MYVNEMGPKRVKNPRENLPTIIFSSLSFASNKSSVFQILKKIYNCKHTIYVNTANYVLHIKRKGDHIRKSKVVRRGY